MDESKSFRFLSYKSEVEMATMAKRRLETFSKFPAYAGSEMKTRDEKTVSDFEVKYGKL